MALEPWFSIFPAAAAVTLVGLAAGVLRRRATLGGAEMDWVVAFLLCAGAFAGLLAAGSAGWTDSGDVVVASTGAGACVGLLAAFSGLHQRYSKGRLGTGPSRWIMFAAALALSSFGAGAYAAQPAAQGDDLVGSWAVVPVVAAAAALFPVAFLVARAGLPRAGIANTVQVLAGALVLAAGLVDAALGDMFVGSALGMAGGAVLYSGVSAVAGRAPAASAPAVKPRTERPEAKSQAAGTGRKVRVPKGAAMRMTSFRDDEQK